MQQNAKNISQAAQVLSPMREVFFSLSKNTPQVFQVQKGAKRCITTDREKGNKMDKEPIMFSIGLSSN